jgi:Tfp pilus assembly protein PilE
MIRRSEKGFTLVELMVIAPIVILLIAAFIALIVNLTGEVLASRGTNTLTYNLQDALNRIEEDVKLSTTYLAVNNIDVSSTKQGYGGTTTTGSTVNFTNIAKSGGSNASLILNGLVTNGNPMSTSTQAIYLANKPAACSSFAEYSKNTPMTMNVVYFIDDNNTLWRRVLMRSDYATTSLRCGSTAPWQQPSCLVGYSTSSLPFCKANDTRMLDGVTPSNFQINYYPSASSTAADTTANNASVTDDSIRGTALQSTPTVSVAITANMTIAGRDISRSGSVRITRLDTNASSIAVESAPTAAPAAPVVSSTVSDGHNVTFTWPRVSGADSYTLSYRVNSGTWQTDSAATGLDNNNRTYTVTAGTHQDTVEARVLATNSFGNSSYGTKSTVIPLWAPLVLKNQWSDYEQGYATAAFTKTKAGVVVLKGLVMNGSGDIATLPADYRPQKALMFATSSNEAGARLDIESNGDIEPNGGGSPWFSISGISFIPSGTTFTDLSFQNGWSNHSTSWANAGYAVDSIGRVHLRGLIKGGTATAGTTISTIPSAVLAPGYTHWVQMTSSAVGHFSTIESSSTLIAKNGTTAGFDTLNAIYFPSAARATGTSCTTQWCNLSLSNSWVHYGTPYSTPQYTKASDGIVHLKGLIRAGTASLIATLSSTYCPDQRMLTTTVSADTWGRIDIVPQGNGTCQILAMNYSNVWVSLDGINYIAW